MVNERYAVAMAETLHYLKGINSNDVNKIPKKLMKLLEDNASKTYVCNFDYTKPLKELKLKSETRGLIAMLCYNYWCDTEEKKTKFKEHLDKNEREYQKKMSRSFDTRELFKDNNVVRECVEENNNANLPIVQPKEGIFKKILNFIKGIVSRK